MGIGVPSDWIEDVRSATEDAFLALSDHLPAEAAEALLEYVATGRLHRACCPSPYRPTRSPIRTRCAVSGWWRTRRRWRWRWMRRGRQWAVFLHPAQQGIVDRTYNGPARTPGSAGTGKTVVALHRAARLARAGARGEVLLTTFSQPLANALSRKLAVLLGEDAASLRRVTVVPWHTVADELHQLAFGRRAVVAPTNRSRTRSTKAVEAVGAKGFTLAIPAVRMAARGGRLADRRRGGRTRRSPAWAARTA